MTKYKTTLSEQKNNNCCIIGAGYCDLQNITSFMNPEAYTSGVYGWRADWYKLQDGIMLATGYDYPNNWGYGKEWKKRAELIQVELYKLEKRIQKGIIKTSANFDKNQKKIRKIIDRIIDKVNNQVQF